CADSAARLGTRAWRARDSRLAVCCCPRPAVDVSRNPLFATAGCGGVPPGASTGPRRPRRRPPNTGAAGCPGARPHGTGQDEVAVPVALNRPVPPFTAGLATVASVPASVTQ